MTRWSAATGRLVLFAVTAAMLSAPRLAAQPVHTRGPVPVSRPPIHWMHPEARVTTSLTDERWRVRQPPNPDRWFGRDKWLHAAVAAALQFTAYGFLRARGVSQSSSHVGASLFTGAASVGKEWHDAKSGGVFSTRDLVWDAAGALAASSAAHQIDG